MSGGSAGPEEVENAGTAGAVEAGKTDSAKKGSQEGAPKPFDPPELYSIHQGTVMGCHAFGAFVRLDGAWDRDALVHVTQLKVAAEGERVETGDVVKDGDRLWVKVIDIAWMKRKYFLSRKFVNQEDGTDLDSGQVELDKEKAKAAEQRAARAAQLMQQVALGETGAAGAAYTSPAKPGKRSAKGAGHEGHAAKAGDSGGGTGKKEGSKHEGRGAKDRKGQGRDGAPSAGEAGADTGGSHGKKSKERRAGAGTAGVGGLAAPATKDDASVSVKACEEIVAQLLHPACITGDSEAKHSDAEASVRAAAALISKTARLLKSWVADAERKAEKAGKAAERTDRAAGAVATEDSGGDRARLRAKAVVPEGRHTQLARALASVGLGKALAAALQRADSARR